jgi:putative redox protein
VHSRPVDFVNRDGHRLSARLDEPLGQTRAHALFAHCFTCSKNLNAVRQVSRELADAGIAVVRFDFTGLGQSGGDFADTNFSSNLEDLIDAAAMMERELAAPSLLVGHSLGGAAVLRVASELESVAAVATIGAPSEPTHVQKLLRPALPELQRQGIAQVELAGRTFAVKQQFLDDLEEHAMVESVGRLGAALLVMHAPQDATVGIDNAASIFKAAKHPKSFVSLDTADHMLSKVEDAVYVGKAIASWADRYLPAAPPAPVDERWPALIQGPQRRFVTTMYIEGHTVLGDEPKPMGGDELAPSPYGYLLGALGECTAMTLRIYADRKKIPLLRADVRLSHGRVHAKDSDAVEGKAKMEVIEREITLIGDELTPEQRQRLLTIADKCPVHRTLTGELHVQTRLTEPESR